MPQHEFFINRSLSQQTDWLEAIGVFIQLKGCCKMEIIERGWIRNSWQNNSECVQS